MHERPANTSLVIYSSNTWRERSKGRRVRSQLGWRSTSSPAWTWHLWAEKAINPCCHCCFVKKRKTRNKVELTKDVKALRKCNAGALGLRKENTTTTTTTTVAVLMGEQSWEEMAPKSRCICRVSKGPSIFMKQVNSQREQVSHRAEQSKAGRRRERRGPLKGRKGGAWKAAGV